MFTDKFDLKPELQEIKPHNYKLKKEGGRIYASIQKSGSIFLPFSTLDYIGGDIGGDVIKPFVVIHTDMKEKVLGVQFFDRDILGARRLHSVEHGERCKSMGLELRMEPGKYDYIGIQGNVHLFQMQ